MVTPEKPFTMSAGQQRFEGGRVVAQAPFAPRAEAAPPAPKMERIADPETGTQYLVDVNRFQFGTRPQPGAPGVAGVVQQPEGPLTLKERQKREALFPKATQSVRSFEDNAGRMVELITKLKDHPALGAILGPIESRLPSVFPGAANAEALFNQIMAKGAFSELQNLRSASPGGGALGNVSNFEVQQLREAFAALNRSQSPKDFKDALDFAVATIEQAKTRLQDAYDETYSYRQAAPAQGGGGGDWSVVR
jgi:hypothetical protein